MNKEFKTVALDIHKIVDGKIKQSYHIEDWHTALEQMLYEKDPPCFGLYPDFTNFHVPKPIKTFYDQILSNPGSQEYGQNMTLINQTLAEDWNIRPNPFSKEQSIQAGPFPRGLKQMTGMWHQMMPDIEVERLQTIKMGNKVAVISEVSATMRDLPQGFDEYPMFPGIPVEKLKGKNFTTLCLAVHVLDDKEHHHDQYEHQHERIRRSRAIEDWTEAADQMLHDRRPAKLDHPWHKPGQNLTSVPHAIHRFYDQILSNPAKAAQNFTLLNETVKEDWTVRPNPADIVGGKGPGVVGLQRIMQLFGEIIPDLKFERKEIFIHEDKVVVLLKVSGTIEKAPQGEEFVPFFPGIEPSEVVGKNFETLAVDIHSIVDDKIQQSYHIEDWRTAAYQMIKGEPVPDFGFHPEYIRFERFNLTEHAHRVPKAIENFYDKMINHLDTYGQNQTLINETFAEDFNMRPNGLSPQKGLHAGPLRNGIKQWFSLKNVMYKDINMTRMYTAEVGDIVLVVGNLIAKMNHIPPGLPGYPQYPGIPEHKLRNKHFNILTMDLHVMDNDKIRRQWHFADHQLALKQMLSGEQNPSLTHDTFPVARFWKPFPNPSTPFMIEFLKIPKTPKMIVSSKRSMLKISLSVLSRWPITRMYSSRTGLSNNSPELRESRKLSEISVISSPISKWKEKPLFFMKTLSLFFPNCLEPSKILARSMMAKKKMKFHSCLVFLLRNSLERGSKPCTWLFTALEMARSSKIIPLKIGPQLFTKCSTTDQLLTLDLRETLLISKCSIFIIMISIMF